MSRETACMGFSLIMRRYVNSLRPKNLPSVLTLVPTPTPALPELYPRDLCPAKFRRNKKNVVLEKTLDHCINNDWPQTEVPPFSVLHAICWCNAVEKATAVWLSCPEVVLRCPSCRRNVPLGCEGLWSHDDAHAWYRVPPPGERELTAVLLLNGASRVSHQ